MRRPLAVLAADLRRRSGSIEPPFSTSKIIEACFPRAIVAGEALAPGIETVSSRTASDETFIYSRSLSTTERRVALAHALAQTIFGLVDDAASEFAAELLAPLDDLAPLRPTWREDVSDERDLYLDRLDDLAERYGVPADMIVSQLRRLDARTR